MVIYILCVYSNITMPTTDPSYYTTTMNTIDSSLESMLVDFVQKYSNYYNNPNNQTHQSNYNNLIANINTKIREMAQLSSSIYTENATLNSDIHTMNSNIRLKKETNRQLKHTLGMTDDQKTTAEELIDNYNDIYNASYTRNIGLLLSILASTYLLGYSSRKVV